MATGGGSEREDRLRRRNLEKDIEELRDARRRLVQARRETTPRERETESRLFNTTFPLPRVVNETRRNEAKDLSSPAQHSLRVRSEDIELRAEDRSSTREKEHSPFTVFDHEDLSDDEVLESTSHTMSGTRSNIVTLGDIAKDWFPERKKQTPSSRQTDTNDKRLSEVARQNEIINEIEAKLEKEQKELQSRLQLLSHQEHIQKTREEKMRNYMISKDLEYEQRRKELYEKFHDREITLQDQEARLKELEITMTAKLNRIGSRLEQREKELDERERSLNRREAEIQAFHSCKHGYESEEEEKLFEIDRQIEALERERGRVKIVKEETKEEPNNKHQTIEKEDIHKEESRKKAELAENINIKLNISPFSGSIPVPKNEALIEDLKLEVEGLQAIYADHVIKHSLRKALRGQAKKMMLRMSVTASVKEILTELEDNFGNVASSDTLLSRFLSAEQESSESLVDWGLRLEELLLQVHRKSRLDESEKKSMLRKRFWRGLRSEELRNATRVHFESPISYSELRNKVREEEYEMQLAKEKGGKQKITKLHQTSAEADSDSKLLKELMKKVEDLSLKFDDMKKNSMKIKTDKNIKIVQKQIQAHTEVDLEEDIKGTEVVTEEGLRVSEEVVCRNEILCHITKQTKRKQMTI